MRSNPGLFRLVIATLVAAFVGAACEPLLQTGCPLPEPPPGSFAITSVSPCDGDTDVALNTPVVITFNRSADPATLSATLRPQIDPQAQWSSNNTRLDIRFPGGLQADTTYTVIFSECRDTAGNSLAQSVTICFSTGSSLGECHTPLACQAPSATDPDVPAYTSYSCTPLFASDSPFNTQIGADPQIDSASAALINAFAQTADSYGGMWLGFGHDVVPIYFADADTPRYDVALTSSWTPIPTRTGVPIPDHAIPDCGDDNFMCVFDTINNRLWDFWQVTEQSDGSWSGSWATSIDATGSGIYPGVYQEATQGVRVSQFALIAGAIWPHELTAGRIDHALVFVYPLTRSGVYTPPARGTDGPYDDPTALPIGARLQLDPSLDLNSLNLESYERVIAKAMQDYGMYLSDTGGGISLSTVHPYSFAGNPYQGLLPDSVVQEGGVLLSSIPADRFRVLQMSLTQAN